MLSKKVGGLLGRSTWVTGGSSPGPGMGVVAPRGSGLTCSAVTSKRLRAVPMGTQVMRVSTGTSVS